MISGSYEQTPYGLPDGPWEDIDWSTFDWGCTTVDCIPDGSTTASAAQQLKPTDLWSFITVDGLRLPGAFNIPWFMVVGAIAAIYFFKKGK